MMKIVFMGTPNFAVGILEAILLSGKHEIASVVTATDKPAGRGMQVMKSAVKQFTEQHNLPFLQPEKLKDPAFIDTLQNLQADVFVVVAFRMLPEAIWKIPSKGTINLHASLLPQYRGAAPINWAIINGETKSGVTTFFINEKIDEGNLILSQEIPVSEDDTAGDLHDKLLHIGKDAILKTLDQIATCTVTETRQQKGIPLKFAPKIYKKDCLINWRNPANDIYNLIRGMSPYPAAFTRYIHSNEQEQILKIYKSHIELNTNHPQEGMIETDNKTYLRIACNNGYIYVDELQLIGKKRMPIKDFLLGNKTLHLKQCK